jgi:hypothetical protein
MKEKHIMENQYIDIGYEFWQRGYIFCDGFAGEAAANKLYLNLRNINNVVDFLDWVLENRPEMIYDYVAEERRYREENEPKIRQFFAEHFEGKTRKEIDPEYWGWYSDWHKDVFGYRPHGIVCGEYINPHRA